MDNVDNVYISTGTYGSFGQPDLEFGPDFKRAISLVLQFEGGISGDPFDRGNLGGSLTNYGITQSVYNQWRKERGLAFQSTRFISALEVSQIYYFKYWLPSAADKLPPELKVIHFDAAVNHGIGVANRLLQQAVGVEVDGVIGPVTLSRVYAGNLPEIVSRYLLLRRDLYHNIVNKNPLQRRFLTGWLNRINKLRNFIPAVSR